ncbi:glucosidase [Methylacidimicrobium sp. B4]|uniref:MGH1-like glycoside hydrolase domain-containing protein n=1 Tax=Methylacidimicrobium sp. B4 TaxID=2796139 RepID=UPI001A8E8580|nr:glucosidase [Methylacidimicrobium sp. B4]QSR85302.1 glucosidase [Methylacidimicrobium sp. B4]
MSREEQRLREAAEGIAPWRLWGPYLSDRQWGTVREDYSPNGDAWSFFPHDHARSRAYRWGEDGLGGICDEGCRLCFALALWNGVDPILKERLFGLSNTEGNHGEDVKEYYFPLEATPTHSYLKFLYKYPQRAFPYDDLLAENRGRKADLHLPEYELLDTGIFDDGAYFDVWLEYAKEGPTDMAIRIRVTNRSPASAHLHVLPTLWFRNTWSWNPGSRKPMLRAGGPSDAASGWIAAEHPELDPMRLYHPSAPELLFVENETNRRRFGWGENTTPYPKDGIHDSLIHGLPTVNPLREGTKAAVHYPLFLGPGESREILLRLSSRCFPAEEWSRDLEAILARGLSEAEEFYARKQVPGQSEELHRIERQAFAGLLWNKQFYHYVVSQWLEGDRAFPPPPASRYRLPNARWRHFYAHEVLTMPDKWEFPWFASWDLCFQAVVLAMVDPEDAKKQLLLLASEWYMHPDGQIPACEWSFSEVNPPLHAWAAWRIYEIERKNTGKGDRAFLVRIFHRCLLFYTWWLNRKDADGNDLFQGGFLGLDNIGLFDRSAVPPGSTMYQVDASSWMGLFTINMMEIAIELAREDPAFEGIVTEFFLHFGNIAAALNHVCSLPEALRERLWDPEDHFYYDVLRLPSGRFLPLKARSLQGIMPVFAVGSVPKSLFQAQDGRVRERIRWFLRTHPALEKEIVPLHATTPSGDKEGGREAGEILLSLVSKEQLRSLLRVMLDEREFLSPFGIRSVSKFHEDHPLELRIDGRLYRLDYAPGASLLHRFGGNSNWRGPIWFPINFLLIESLQKYHHYYGEEFRVECPTGTGRLMNLWEVSQEISRRLVSIFTRDGNGRRPVFGNWPIFGEDPAWTDCPLFFEYFHGDTGAGLGASHQAGWTALVAKLIHQLGEYPEPAPSSSRLP